MFEQTQSVPSCTVQALPPKMALQSLRHYQQLLCMTLCQGHSTAHGALRRRMPSCCLFMSPFKAPKIPQALMNCMYELFCHCISFNPTLPQLYICFMLFLSSPFFMTAFWFLWSCMQHAHLFFLDYVFRQRKKQRRKSRKGRKKERRKKETENSKNPESNVSGTAIILYEAAGKIDCQGSKG